MRLGSVLSEALRNIGSGVSRAFAMFLAVLLSGTLLGGYEAMTVIDLESQAVQRINAYADVNAIVGGTVDGTACDRLSDAGDGMTGTLAGAMRAGEQVVPLATPGKDISSYDVTPGMIRLIAGNAKADVSGVWVPRDVAKDFGLAVGSALRTREGTTRVAGVFGYFDGRDLDSAVMIRYIECENGRFYFRSGGGITVHSAPQQEYDEVVTKIYLPIP